MTQGTQPGDAKWPTHEAQFDHEYGSQVGRASEVGKRRATTAQGAWHVHGQQAIAVPVGRHAHLFHDGKDAAIALHTVGLQSLQRDARLGK